MLTELGVRYRLAGKSKWKSRFTEVVITHNKKPTRDEIARRAYELYVQRGGEHGKHVEDWVRAEKELSDEPADRFAVTEASRELVSRRADLRSKWPE